MNTIKMKLQRFKFTIEGELSCDPETTERQINQHLRASTAYGVHSFRIARQSVSVDAVPTPNTMQEIKPRPETVRKEKPFDPKKPFQARDGRKARLLADDLRGPYPLVAAVESYAGDVENEFKFTLGGRADIVGETDIDLINIPEKHVRWVNFDEDGSATTHESEADSRVFRCSSTIAALRVEFTEGEGL